MATMTTIPHGTEPVVGNVILLGNFTVGKTSFFNRAKTGRFLFDTSGTQVPAGQTNSSLFHETTYNVRNGECVKIIMHDTADQERFKSVSKQYYRGATVVLLVYAVDDASSFEAVTYWLAEVQHHNPHASVLVVGNKMDRPSVILREDIRELRRENEISYLSTVSVKTGENFDSLMQRLAEIVYVHIKEGGKKSTIQTTVEISSQYNRQNNSGCCSKQ